MANGSCGQKNKRTERMENPAKFIVHHPVPATNPEEYDKEGNLISNNGRWKKRMHEELLHAKLEKQHRKKEARAALEKKRG